ncbi:MAG TPA: hypothetical protein VNT55_20930, partial [Baekduia sp.]|nr:hypothetical protein [Baekduia sp.]
RRVSSVEHGACHRLTVRFAGGGAVVFRRAIREVDWLLDHAASGATLEAYPATGRGPRPERDLVLRRPGGGVAAIHRGDAIAPLVGQRAATVEHHDDGRLELAFAGGSRLVVVPTTEEFENWTAWDGASGRGIKAMRDGSLVADRGPDGMWGTLGVLRAPAYRPAARPAPRATAAVPCTIADWGRVLGELTGQRLAWARAAPPHAVRLAFAPGARMLADTCDITVDDGAARILFHRTGRGVLSDRDAAIAALGALSGRTVEGVELGERHRLTLALSDGGAIVLGRARPEVHAWQLIDRRSDRRLAALPVDAGGGPPPGEDAGRLVLRDLGDEALLTISGGLGAVTAAAAADGRARASRLGAARALLAAPAGLPLTKVHATSLEFGAPEVRERHPSRPVWISLERCDVFLHAPGHYGAGRRIADDDLPAALRPLLGVPVGVVRHDAPGRLTVAFAGGHALVLTPAERAIPEWSVALGAGGPWVAAMADDSLRTMEPGAGRADAAERWQYGSLGWLA